MPRRACAAGTKRTGRRRRRRREWIASRHRHRRRMENWSKSAASAAAPRPPGGRRQRIDRPRARQAPSKGAPTPSPQRVEEEARRGHVPIPPGGAEPHEVLVAAEPLSVSHARMSQRRQHQRRERRYREREGAEHASTGGQHRRGLEHHQRFTIGIAFAHAACVAREQEHRRAGGQQKARVRLRAKRRGRAPHRLASSASAAITPGSRGRSRLLCLRTPAAACGSPDER